MLSKPDNISPDITTPEKPASAEPRRFRYSQDAAKPQPAAGPIAGAAVAASPRPVALPLDWSRIMIALAAAGLCFLALYPAELWELQTRWYTDAGWSHGYVVPLISAFFISLKWDTLRQLTPRSAPAGLAILLLGVTGQVLFRATGVHHMSNLSIVVVLLGAVLFIFGWQFMKVLWLPIAYLVCAIPLPGPLYVKLTTPMQVIAAQVGVWMLPLVGGEGTRTGTVIQVVHGGGVVNLDVAQACSGMRMLVAFFAVAVALAYSTNRPVWQKVFLAACALPIAILCNALRVTMTGVLAARWGEEWAKGSAHAYFGLLMLIPALFMQLGVAWILDRMFIDDASPAGPVAMAGGAP